MKWWRVGDTAAFRFDLEGPGTLIPLAFALPLTKHSCFLSPNCSPRAPFFWRRRKDHPEQKGLSILSYLKPSIEFCKKEYGKYSKSFFKSSEGGGKGSENNIMILFSGSQLQVPFFQISWIPLKEEKNYFPSQYLRGETPLDLAVPYGLNFLSVPIQPVKGWNSARIASLLWKALPNRRA